MKKFIVACLFLVVFTDAAWSKTVKSYFQDGKIYSVQVYDKQGRVIGPYRVYYPNGQLSEKTWYKNHKPSHRKTWTMSGQPMPEEIYQR